MAVDNYRNIWIATVCGSSHNGFIIKYGVYQLVTENLSISFSFEEISQTLGTSEKRDRLQINNKDLAYKS